MVSRFQQLSPAEIRSLRAVARYDSTAEAAARLEVSEQTVKNELSAAYRKLRVRNRVGAFNRLGWLRVPPDQQRIGRRLR